MTLNATDAVRIVRIARLRFIYAPQGEGEDLCRILTAHGIDPVIQRESGISFDRLELPAGADIAAVHEVLGDWSA